MASVLAALILMHLLVFVIACFQSFAYFISTLKKSLFFTPYFIASSIACTLRSNCSVIWLGYIQRGAHRMHRQLLRRLEHHGFVGAWTATTQNNILVLWFILQPLQSFCSSSFINPRFETIFLQSIASFGCLLQCYHIFSFLCVCSRFGVITLLFNISHLTKLIRAINSPNSLQSSEIKSE